MYHPQASAFVSVSADNISKRMLRQGFQQGMLWLYAVLLSSTDTRLDWPAPVS